MQNLGAHKCAPHYPPEARSIFLEHVSRLSPEFKLLVNCSWIAPLHLREFQEKQTLLLCNKVNNWENFIALVDRHRVAAIAYQVLNRQQALSSLVREQLKKLNERSRLQALSQTAEWLRLAKLFSTSGIRMLPLKGAILSHYLYSDSTMRLAQDLDILVDRQELERAFVLLRKDGYSLVAPGVTPTPKQWRFVLESTHHFVLYHQKRRTRVELHWDCLYGKTLDDLWKSTISINLMGIDFRLLDRDLLLVFLCCHGAQHAWSRLKWLGDIATLLSGSHPEDWAENRTRAYDLACSWGLRRHLGQATLLVEKLYGIPVPRELVEYARNDHKMIRLANDALKTSQAPLTSKTKDTFLRIAYQLRLQPDWRLNINLKKILCSLAINIGDFKKIRLSDRFFWLYCPLRLPFWIQRRAPAKAKSLLRSYQPRLPRWYLKKGTG